MQRRVSLAWGVQPFQLARRKGFHALLRSLDRWLLERRMIKRGEIIVVLMGDALGKALERTNLMRLHRVGSSLP